MSPAFRKIVVLIVSAAALVTSGPVSAETVVGTAVMPPPPPDGQPVVRGEITIEPGSGFSAGFAPRAGGFDIDTVYVDADGVLSLGGRPDAGFIDARGVFAQRPAIEGSVIVAPLLTPLGGECPDVEDTGIDFNAVRYAVEGDELIVVWRNMLPAVPDCEGKLAAQLSTFSARLSWGPTLRVTFTYYRIAPHGDPQSGVVFPDGVSFELLVEGDKLRTDRIFVLLNGGSEGEPGETAADRVWIQGQWVMEFDERGRLVGDVDADGVRSADNCIDDPNVGQRDLDGDAQGDACDGDLDGDDQPNFFDNCPAIANEDQSDLDGDGVGNACDLDDDGDGVFDIYDLCPTMASSANLDLDGDGRGDPCDPDIDGDAPFDQRTADLCPHVRDANTGDRDQDGVGDACDILPRLACDPRACRFEVDADGDQWVDVLDNCPTAPNPDQQDFDGDGVGNACDADCNGNGRLDVYEIEVRAICRAPAWNRVKIGIISNVEQKR